MQPIPYFSATIALLKGDETIFLASNGTKIHEELLKIF